MNKEILNKVKVNFAQGEREFQNAKQNLNVYYDGKIRTIARRAVGFYVDGYVIFTNKKHYGNSFMNHLRGLENDKTIPTEINNSASALTMKMKNEELTGKEAIKHAEILISFCKEELNKFIIKENRNEI